jgi:hypothetical protein
MLNSIIIIVVACHHIHQPCHLPPLMPTAAVMQANPDPARMYVVCDLFVTALNGTINICFQWVLMSWSWLFVQC